MAHSDEKHEKTRPVGAEPVDLVGKPFRAPVLTVDGRRDDMRFALDLREDTLARGP